MRLGIKADSFVSLGKIPQASRRLIEPIRKIIPLLAPRKKHKSRILVVDDEDLVVDLLDHHLTRAGYEVVKAADGETALERMIEALPAVVILAIMLPGIQARRC